MIGIEQVLVTPEGLKGRLDMALDFAGFGGTLLNFADAPEPLYGFQAYALGMKGNPGFSVVMSDLSLPHVHDIRPLSWTTRWKHCTAMTAAQYAELRIKGVLHQTHPGWCRMSGLDQYAVLEEMVGRETVWQVGVDSIQLILGRQPVVGADGGKTEEATVLGAHVNFNDGSILVAEPGTWPRVKDYGLMKSVKMDETGARVEHEYVYDMAVCGRA